MQKLTVSHHLPNGQGKGSLAEHDHNVVPTPVEGGIESTPNQKLPRLMVTGVAASDPDLCALMVKLRGQSTNET